MKYTKLFLLVILFLASCATPATSAPVPTQTFTPEPTATQTPIPTPTITPAPTQVGGGTGKLIFELNKAESIKTFANLEGELNVFTANLDGTDLTPVTNGLKGYNYLESVSPDGTKALIASTSNENFRNDQNPVLYLIDLNQKDFEPVELASGLPQDNGRKLISKWIDNTTIVYIGQGETGFGIYAVNIENSATENIYKYENDGDGHKPVEILSVTESRIYWIAEVRTSLGGNKSSSKDFVWWSSIDGSEQGKLEFDGNQIFSDGLANDLALSPDGTQIAWIGEKATATLHNNSLYIASISDINNPYKLDTNSSFLDLAWSPDGSKIMIFDIGSILFKGDPADNLFGFYEVSVSPDLPIKNDHNSSIVDTLLPAGNGGFFFSVNVLNDFSPDGRHILVSSSSEGKARLLDLETMTISEVLNGVTLPNSTHTGVHWLP